jgi:hypothetical protein
VSAATSRHWTCSPSPAIDAPVITRQQTWTAYLQLQRLPVAGIETARKLVDETLPSNTLMARWAQSENAG